MYFSWSSNVCDHIHLWHFKKAAEIDQHKKQLSPASDQINMSTQAYIPGWNICDWEESGGVLVFWFPSLFL